MLLVSFAALVVAQAGSAEVPLRVRANLNCVAVPVLMSAQATPSPRRAASTPDDRRTPRPSPRCLRLSAR